MGIFKKHIGNNILLKLYKNVSQEEAEAFDNESLIDFLINEFEKIGLKLDNFYITGPYPKNGWKTTKGFLNGLKKKSYQNIHHLMISDSENKMLLNFQNWSHNRTIKVDNGSIEFELMLDENLISENELILFSKQLNQFLNFEYGNIFKLSKQFSICESKIRKWPFYTSELENQEYKKWSKYSSAVKYGFIRELYKLNFLSSTHLNNRNLKTVIDQFGKLEQHTEFFLWMLSDHELSLAKAFVETSEILVINKAFDKTETCKFIDKEFEKYALIPDRLVILNHT